MKFECKQCNKAFKNYRALNSHRISSLKHNPKAVASRVEKMIATKTALRHEREREQQGYNNATNTVSDIAVVSKRREPMAQRRETNQVLEVYRQGFRDGVEFARSESK